MLKYRINFLLKSILILTFPKKLIVDVFPTFLYLLLNRFCGEINPDTPSFIYLKALLLLLKLEEKFYEKFENSLKKRK